MKCPRDGSPLVFVDDGRHMRDRCAKCEGILLDQQELQAALSKRGAGAAELRREHVEKLPDGGLACPRDKTPMRRLDRNGVEIDVCPECSSLWFDAGEFQKAHGAKSARKLGMGGAAAVAGAAAAGVAVAAAAAPGRQSLASGLAEGVSDVVAEGAIDLVFEFAVDAIGALFS